MLKRILSFMEDQGFDEDSPMKLWQINDAFDSIISADGPKKQFPRNITNLIWTQTPKNEDNQVILDQFLSNMETQNKLRHLLPESYIHDDAPQLDESQPQEIQTSKPSQAQPQDLGFQTDQKPQQNEQISEKLANEQKLLPEQQKTRQQQTTMQPQIEEYSERQSVEVRNINYNDSVSNNINGTIAESEGNMGSLLGHQSSVIHVHQQKNQKPVEKIEPQDQPKKVQRRTEEMSFNEVGQNMKREKKKANVIPEKQPGPKSKLKEQAEQESSLLRPLIRYDHEPTQQQIEQELTRDIPRPQIKNKSGVKSSPIKQSSIIGTEHRLNDRLLEQEGVEKENLVGKQKKKCMSKKWFIPMCVFVLGLVVFMSSFIIHAELKKLAADQVILKPDTENIWAHFPGDTKTQIDRNWTFFSLQNPDEFLFYNQTPLFRQIKGFKIIELEDYLNITYIEDGNRVQMVDWLHFAEQPESRNLDQKVEILNVGGLAYWYNIKVARPTIILQQGLGLLFNTLETSILENIYAQAINVQFLPAWSDDLYAEMFAPIEISFDEAWFIWTDPAYGMGNQDNLKYWIQAVNTQSNADASTISQGANFLMDYFTLSLEQIKFFADKFQEFIDFAESSVLQNAYCFNQTTCTGRYLAYQQFSTSYVTRNPPPGKPIQPNDTICLSNVTCSNYFPELSAFYNNVYLKRHPQANSTLEFDPEWMKNIVNYNASIDEKLDFNTAQNCLFHIGNLDALWDNGTLYEKSIQELSKSKQSKASLVVQSKYLQNIKTRFNLPSLNHTHVFWRWIKYLNNEVILQNNTNEQLGVANLFANGLYQAFSYLQDNLQSHLLTELVLYDLENQAVGDCATFVTASFGLKNSKTGSNICDKYGQKITKELVGNLLAICTNEFKESWFELKNRYDLSIYELGTLCEYDPQNNATLGYWLHMRRTYLNDMYDCKITPKEYCSDYELAAIQWSSSKVTLHPPPELNMSPNHTYKAWNTNASRFEYAFYVSKYPNDETFPTIFTKQAYTLLNFDHWFSAPVVLRQFTNATFNDKLKAYMRFVALEVGLNGLTMQRTARELIFGYKDEILEQVKNAYPPFGGDPSTPSLIAFNDPNITKEEATMTLEWSTGKQNSSLVGQYRKINGFQYLTIEKDFFNGNMTKTQFISPWQGEDYVYGTSAKQFSPDQFDQPNISLYVPNIQRYGSGIIDDSTAQERFGFDVQVGYLGGSIYESTEESDVNKKYYQSFYAMFNQTSVVGFPLFVSKNHFMNVSQNWTSLVEIWDQNSTIRYVNVSKYDDSFVVVEPYTGLSFQSTIYLQSNYHHAPDSLLSFYQQVMLPVFSLARSGNITESVVEDLLGPLKMGIAVVKWTKIIGIVLVVVSCIVCGYVYYRKKKEEKKANEHKDSESQGQEDEGDSSKEEERKGEKKEVQRQIKSSQLGISLQPMSSSGNTNKQEYVPPVIVEQQI